MDFNPSALLERINDPEFEFNLRGWKEPARGFFAPSPHRAELLAERRHWLAHNPERHLVYLPTAADMVLETIELARIFDPAFMPPAGAEPPELLKSLGQHWECDLILCRTPLGGQMSMEAGVVCFPSYWAPEEKIGLPVWDVHAPVPGLNAAIGHKIDHLLNRLPPGSAWLRLNWGLSASAERNQHPLHRLPRLTGATPIESIWLRLEHQALLRLPVTAGVLFGIQLYSFSMPALRAKPAAASAVAGQLRSMPLEMRVYKGIHHVASRVADWLA